MENTGKIILWILVAILVLGGIYYWYANRSVAPATPHATTQSTQTPTAPNQPSLASGSASSDSALSQDLSGMDAQMAAMTSDTAAIDSGMNDKPVAQ